MINYYVEYWKSDNEERNNEIIDCINSNIDLNLFDNIFIFSNSKEEKINHELILSERVSYQLIFDNTIDGINVFANSDIKFDETIVKTKNISDDEFYTITRYEDDGKLHKHDDPYRGCDSQDTWVWKNKCKIKDANFFIGIPGCDNKIAYMAEISGYKVKNPAYDIKTYHKHKTNIRSGTSANLNFRLPPPYKLVQIGNI